VLQKQWLSDEPFLMSGNATIVHKIGRNYATQAVIFSPGKALKTAFFEGDRVISHPMRCMERTQPD